jgi:hypothetical protein
MLLQRNNVIAEMEITLKQIKDDSVSNCELSSLYLIPVLLRSVRETISLQNWLREMSSWKKK